MNPERLLLLLPLVMLVDRAALFRNIATPRDPLEYYVGEDALFNWTKSDGQKIHSASWGIEKQNMPDPFFIHINVYTKKVNLNKDTDQKYINRVYFVGNLTEGRAWFMLKNLTISDTNKYIAVIRDNEHGVLHSTVKMKIKSKVFEHTTSTTKPSPTRTMTKSTLIPSIPTTATNLTVNVNEKTEPEGLTYWAIAGIVLAVFFVLLGIILFLRKLLLRHLYQKMPTLKTLIEMKKEKNKDDDMQAELQDPLT